MLKPVTHNMDVELWERARRHGLDIDATGGALIEAALEDLLDASPAKRAAREKRAQEITAERRRRAD